MDDHQGAPVALPLQDLRPLLRLPGVRAAARRVPEVLLVRRRGGARRRRRDALVRRHGRQPAGRRLLVRARQALPGRGPPEESDGGMSRWQRRAREAAGLARRRPQAQGLRDALHHGALRLAHLRQEADARPGRPPRDPAAAARHDVADLQVDGRRRAAVAHVDHRRRHRLRPARRPRLVRDARPHHRPAHPRRGRRPAHVLAPALQRVHAQLRGGRPRRQRLLPRPVDDLGREGAGARREAQRRHRVRHRRPARAERVRRRPPPAVPPPRALIPPPLTLPQLPRVRPGGAARTATPSLTPPTTSHTGTPTSSCPPIRST